MTKRQQEYVNFLRERGTYVPQSEIEAHFKTTQRGASLVLNRLLDMKLVTCKGIPPGYYSAFGGGWSWGLREIVRPETVR